MTEQAVTVQDVVVTPSRPRRRRIKSPEEIAWEKRVTRVVSKFVVGAMTPTVREIGARLAAVERNAANLRAQNNRLEKEVADADKRNHELLRVISDEVLRYRGVWLQDKTFQPGSCVTHSGSLWLAEAATDRRPGTDRSSWRLIVKNGSFR